MNVRKRLLRLERFAAPIIERVKKDDEAQHLRIGMHAEIHALNFAALLIYGSPKLEEPLSEAWVRCIQSSIWKDFDHPGGLWRNTPFEENGAEHIALYLLEKWFPSLPGNNRKEIFEPIFFYAPPWLIWFTLADWTADVLNVALPDLSEIKKFHRPPAMLSHWPCLPKGKFDLPLRQDDFDRPDISPMDLEFYKEKLVAQDEMTRLERKRFNSICEKLP